MSMPEKAEEAVHRDLSERQNKTKKFPVLRKPEYRDLEVTPRFELGNDGFADRCLTTWLCHLIK